MMKVGWRVEHALDGRKQGRVVYWRKGKKRVLVKWDDGQCTEHHISAVSHIPR